MKKRAGFYLRQNIFSQEKLCKNGFIPTQAEPQIPLRRDGFDKRNSAEASQ
jgi:hypothetical protein